MEFFAPSIICIFAQLAAMRFCASHFFSRIPYFAPMLFARIPAPILFALMFLPVGASALLINLAEHNPERHLRFLTLSLNFSTFFAMIFVSWIATLVYILAPGFRSRFFIYTGLVIAVLFRFWQDSFMMEGLNVTGQIPDIESVSFDSPVFVMHAIVSLFMIALLILLPLWLLKKEKALGFPEESKGKTILWFFVFPVGIFFIQPRMKRILDN